MLLDSDGWRYTIILHQIAGLHQSCKMQTMAQRVDVSPLPCSGYSKPSSLTSSCSPQVPPSREEGGSRASREPSSHLT